MEDQEDRVPRMRDLGDARQPHAGVPELGRVGDVGELPYAVDEEGDGQVERSPRALLIGLAVVLVVVIAIVLALVI